MKAITVHQRLRPAWFKMVATGTPTRMIAISGMRRNYASLPIRQQPTERDWQHKATEARRLAQTMTDKFITQELVQIAASYDRIANVEREQARGT